MFKRLRTKIAEEAQRFPIQDLIDLNNSTGNPILQPENEQFSINDEDDSNTSEANSPYRIQENAGQEITPIDLTDNYPEATSSVLTETENSTLGIQNYKMHTDTESEREDAQTIELERISKEQLFFALQKLRSKTQKYKIRYTEAITAYKEVSSEKEKLQHALSEAQDRTLRRLAELREQCQLEQEAKAHLEQNLQMMLDEKEQMIYVLETKVHLLKESSYSDKQEANQCENTICFPELENKEIMKEENIKGEEEELQALREKVKRQEALLAKCKDTIKSNKERTTQLIDEKNNLLEQLEKKNKEQEDLQVQESEIQSNLQAEILEMREKLNELEKQQEENSMAMAETKRNMHEELELREQQLSKLKSELQNVQHEKELLQKKVEEQESKYIELQNKHEEAISNLQNQLEITENNMEKERESLMHELSRGKAAALSLLKDECEKKINAIEEEWNLKVEELKEKHEKTLAEKDECEKKRNAIEEEWNLKIEELKEKYERTLAEKNETIKEDTRLHNSHLYESLLVAETNQSAISEELDNYKYQVAELHKILDQLRKEKMEEETKFKQELESLMCENNKLTNNKEALDDLQKERDEIAEKLKAMENNCNKNNEGNIVLALQEENKKLKEECAITIELKKNNEQLKKKLDEIERDKEELKCTLQREIMTLQSEKSNLEEEHHKTKICMELSNQQFPSKQSDDDTPSQLREEIALLKEQLQILETQTFGISHVENYQNQLTSIKNNYEVKLKEKDMELSSKLKQMVRDFASQMDQKEAVYEKTLSSLIAEKGQQLESKMERQHREEMVALEQELYEKNCALEDVTEHYQQLFCEKEGELQTYKEKIKETEICKKNNGEANETNQIMFQTEANDWEVGWMDAEDSTSIPHKNTTGAHCEDNLHCTEHLEAIKILESSIASSQEEIAELRFLLGLTNRSLTSPDANYTNEISLKLPEPTEFEYLRNILYEYMMGKEPMILARVIAAVLKFTEEQTNEILQKESFRQTLRNHWMSS